MGNGASASFQFIANVSAGLEGDAVLELRGGGNPLNGSTVDFAADATGAIRFLAESVANVESEHLGKITVDGIPAVPGVNFWIYDEAGVTVATPVNPNVAPVAVDAELTIAENVSAGSSAGFISASDANEGDVLSYAITSGNAGGEFAINSATGEVVSTAVFDHESTASFSFTVTVTDAEGLSDSAEVTVHVSNVNEAPSISGATAAVSEFIEIGSVVAQVSSSDPDQNDPASFTITAGNTGGAFAIDSLTGVITTAAELDYETLSSYSLTVRATDAGGLYAEALVDVSVLNENITPWGNNNGGVDQDSFPGKGIGNNPHVGDPDDFLDFILHAGATGKAIPSGPKKRDDVSALEDEVVVSKFSTSEQSGAGSTLAGSSHENTHLSDNRYEVLKEAKTSGKQSSSVSSLDHTWSFDIGEGGVLVELSVEAFHSANAEGDDFIFSYSTDGVLFTDLITVTKTEDDDLAQVAPLPAGVSGAIYIRVRDADRTAGNNAQNALSVDRLSLG